MKSFGMVVGLLLGIAGSAGAQALTCNAGVVPPVPTFSTSSVLGTVADVTLFCVAGLTPGSVLSLNFNFTLGAPELNTGPWTLTEGTNNYSGTFAGPNQIQFTGVSFDTSKPTLSFELFGVQVNPSLKPYGFEYDEFISVTGNTVPQINNPIQVVAFNNVPEPSTFGLTLAAGLAALRRRTRR